MFAYDHNKHQLLIYQALADFANGITLLLKRINHIVHLLILRDGELY